MVMMALGVLGLLSGPGSGVVVGGTCPSMWLVAPALSSFLSPSHPLARLMRQGSCKNGNLHFCPPSSFPPAPTSHGWPGLAHSRRVYVFLRRLLFGLYSWGNLLCDLVLFLYPPRSLCLPLGSSPRPETLGNDGCHKEKVTSPEKSAVERLEQCSQ